MNIFDILKDVETDVATFGNIATETRTKVKDGLTEISNIRDETVATIDI